MRLDIEVLPKAEEKEMFRTFCEDFNTATLPHKKYYDLAEYERKRADESSKRGLSEVQTLPAAMIEEIATRSALAVWSKSGICMVRLIAILSCMLMA